MLDALENFFQLPEYLLWIIRSYISERELMYTSADGLNRREVTAGAAQGVNLMSGTLKHIL